MAPPANSSSSQVPYIGSTISLLSKAGIRYEGYLHSIDQKEAAVTLDHVRVFGTEDRQCERRVPASSETFEYIIFRAADITELRVIDTPLSRPVPDPAIIRVQVKGPGANSSSESSAPGFGVEAAGGRLAGGVGGGGSGRRRQARVNSAGRGGAGGRAGRGQNLHYHQQQQQQLAPPPPMMQLPVQSPQQSRSRNDYIVYPRYNLTYRGNGGGGGGGAFYPQYRPASLYPAAEFAAAPANSHGYAMRPPSGGGGAGGRPVMHFRRFHGGSAGGGGGGGGGQRRPSPRLVGGGSINIGLGVGGTGRSRHSRRTHQSNGIAEAAANPAKYFSSDYDFETANAEMAKLLLTVKSSAATKPAVVNGVGGVSDEETSASSSVAAAFASSGAADGHCGSGGYDRERSFFDDIGRVDADAGAAAGGDSARLGRKEAARQNALNKETFGLSGRRFHGNHQHQRVATAHGPRRSPV